MGYHGVSIDSVSEYRAFGSFRDGYSSSYFFRDKLVRIWI